MGKSRRKYPHPSRSSVTIQLLLHSCQSLACHGDNVLEASTNGTKDGRLNVRKATLGSNMDVDMASSSTPTMRSAVSAPRSAAGPIAAPRTNTAPAAPRTTTGSTATTAPRQSTPAVPADLQPIRCPLCRRPHRLSHCGIFKGMPPMQRQQVAQAHGYCLNCLATSHATQECPSQNRCQICVRAHHTLLHRATRRDSGRPPAPRTSGNVRRSQRTPVTAWTHSSRISSLAPKPDNINTAPSA